MNALGYQSFRSRPQWDLRVVGTSGGATPSVLGGIRLCLESLPHILHMYMYGARGFEAIRKRIWSTEYSLSLSLSLSFPFSLFPSLSLSFLLG
jgi:hypothetical protein